MERGGPRCRHWLPQPAGQGAAPGSAGAHLPPTCSPSSLPPAHHNAHSNPIQQLDIGYDSFLRTTDARHEALVRDVLERVWERGDIYKANYEGFYCVDCEEYKDEGDMDAGAGGRGAACGTLEDLTSPHPRYQTGPPAEHLCLGRAFACMGRDLLAASRRRQASPSAPAQSPAFVAGG